MKNKYLPFVLILIFSLILAFGPNTNIFDSIGLASLLLLPVVLIKPSLAFPFLKDINRKKGVPVLILLFFLGVMLSPQSKTKNYTTEKQSSPTKKVEAKPSPTGEAKGAQAKTPTPSPKKTATPTVKPTSTTASTSTLKPKITSKVTRVVDGDTIDLENGKRLRYIGIDTPETYECYASQATQKNKELVLGKYIALEKDVSEVDKYGRLLRYVYVGGVFVNDYLVRQGFANVATYPPDVKYADQFRQAEREARENKRGLWVDGVCDSGSQTAPPGAAYTCGSKTYCGEMTSCDEAYYYLNTCGLTRLDGDSDGVPCETICGGGGYQPQLTQPPPADSGGGYSCNCSKTCTQMSSCDEAYYQLNTCGCSRRDGDNDGVPCEKICLGG